MNTKAVYKNLFQELSNKIRHGYSHSLPYAVEGLKQLSTVDRNHFISNSIGIPINIYGLRINEGGLNVGILDLILSVSFKIIITDF